MKSPSEKKPASKASTATSCLIRIGETFDDVTEDILAHLDVSNVKRLEQDYYLVKSEDPAFVRTNAAGLFIRWSLALDHVWPCNPAETDQFIEKTAQTLVKKFAASKPQSILVGSLHPGSKDSYYRRMASNLRGRLLTLFPPQTAFNADNQEPDKPTLFCMVGKAGVFCGLRTPRSCNGFYPGGSMRVALNRDDIISRAGAKIIEALHYLKLHRAAPAERAHWLDLGASPGGMTSALLDRGFRVTAVDPAPLDESLDGRLGLRYFKANAATFVPPSGLPFDAIVCDMNGPPEESMAAVLRYKSLMTSKVKVVFTLKVPRVESVVKTLEIYNRIIAQAEAGGLHLFARAHLTYNRQEFTLFFNLQRSAKKTAR